MGGALVVAIVGTITSWGAWEGVSTTLALLAAISGIPADRWAATAEQRRQTVAALCRELDKNREVLADPRFLPDRQGESLIYPRLMLGAVDTTFISGVFSGPRDAELLRALLDWRNSAEDVNRRLDITELRLCIVEEIDRHDLAALQQMTLLPGGPFAYARDCLEQLDKTLERDVGVPSWKRWGLLA
ncbi:hypothetical protein [Planotetraspora phitsanulokensis]|uniref:hypothetical protein n=1 Tax=Planotetraspora phitsanulokensis TaxID=575192 RepID=UPI00194E2F3D|nr:hypothetical protein [Planotetraspora phitsanulokensis]